MKRWVILIPVFSLFLMVIVPVFSYAQSRQSYGPKAGYSGYHHRAPSSYTGSSHGSYRGYHHYGQGYQHRPYRHWGSHYRYPRHFYGYPYYDSYPYRYYNDYPYRYYSNYPNRYYYAPRYSYNSYYDPYWYPYRYVLPFFWPWFGINFWY